MAAGYSQKSLSEKLRIKEGYKVLILNAPANYDELLKPLPSHVILGRSNSDDSRISMEFPVSAESDSGQARMTEREIQNIAEQLLPKGKAYEWNQALMDYSSAMLREHKIPIPKQSKFQGSHRYYRGQVLKQLLEKKEIPLTELGKLIKNDFKSSEQTWLHNLILELKKEGFITVRKKDIILA